MKDVNITVAPGVAEIIVRNGEAPKVIEPRAYTATGLISAPFNFYKGRTSVNPDIFDKSKTIVEVDRGDMRIVFRGNPNLPLGDVITGILFPNEDLKEFKIGTNDNWRTGDLALFLNRKRMYFKDLEAGRALIASLRSVKVSTKGEIEVSNDQRGNTKNMVIQSVETDIPVSFTLEMPVFEGGEKVSFVVEIYLVLSGSTLYCTLESVDLDQVINAQIDKMINAQIVGFVTEDITIIEI